MNNLSLRLTGNITTDSQHELDITGKSPSPRFLVLGVGRLSFDFIRSVPALIVASVVRIGVWGLGTLATLQESID
jgi:hypothetical protein